MVSEILPVLQLILAAGNVCVLAYALFKFVNKPHDTLESRVTVVENDVKEVKQLVASHEARFEEQEETNEVMQNCLLALIDFELTYCIRTQYDDTTDLIKAKDGLRQHLARR